jgi:excisionase family DNA binding protein
MEKIDLNFKTRIKSQSKPVQEQFDFALSKPSAVKPLPPDAVPKKKKAPDVPPKSPPEGPSLLLNCAEVCALLKISRSTLDRMEKSGALPGRVKIGGQVRYHKRVLEDWLFKLAGNR